MSRTALSTSLPRVGRWLAASLVAVAVAAGPLAAPSAGTADSPDLRPAAAAKLRLSVTHEATGATTTVTLTCAPDGGTHPTPAAACGSLRAVGGRFELLPSVPGVFCPAVFDPVVARASGVAFGQAVQYQERFGNGCEAAVGTDNVFRF